MLRKVSYVNKLCTYNKVLPSIYDIYFLKFIQSFVYVWARCPQHESFPSPQLLWITISSREYGLSPPHPLPPSCPSPMCSHAKSWNMSRAVQGGGWKKEGLSDWCPRVWLWVVLSLWRKFHERTVNSSHFIHAFMNVDVCAFQFCDCFSLYFHYFGVGPGINIFSFPIFIVVTGFLNQLLSSLTFFWSEIHYFRTTESTKRPI